MGDRLSRRHELGRLLLANDPIKALYNENNAHLAELGLLIRAGPHHRGRHHHCGAKLDKEREDRIDMLGSSSFARPTGRGANCSSCAYFTPYRRAARSAARLTSTPNAT
jgi:hypothetical protein